MVWAAEEMAGDRAAKTLKAALRIVQPRQRQGADHGVEDPPDHVPVRRLVVAHGAHLFARSDGNVKIRQCRRDEVSYLIDGHRKVGVAHEQILSAGLQHAEAHGVSLTAFVELKGFDLCVAF